MYILGMAEGPRTRGRKAKGYVPLRTIADVRRALVEYASTEINGTYDEQPIN